MQVFCDDPGCLIVIDVLLVYVMRDGVDRVAEVMLLFLSDKRPLCKRRGGTFYLVHRIRTIRQADWLTRGKAAHVN